MKNQFIFSKRYWYSDLFTRFNLLLFVNLTACYNQNLFIKCPILEDNNWWLLFQGFRFISFKQTTYFTRKLCTSNNIFFVSHHFMIYKLPLAYPIETSNLLEDKHFYKFKYNPFQILMAIFTIYIYEKYTGIYKKVQAWILLSILM